MTSSLSLRAVEMTSLPKMRQVVLVGVADLFEEAMKAESLQQA
jgi:hypothetical protein